MNIKLRLIASATLAAATIYGSAQTMQPLQEAYRIKDEGFNRSKVEQTVHLLTDVAGPRLTASPGKLRAERLTADWLDSLGFKNVRIEHAMDFHKGGWQNDRNYVAMTAPYYCSFAATPMAWSGGTEGEVNGECVYTAIRDFCDLEQYRGKLRGKIALLPEKRPYRMSLKPIGSRFTDEELTEMELDYRTGAPDEYEDNEAYADSLERAINAFMKEEGALAIIAGEGAFNVPRSRSVLYAVGDPIPATWITLPIEDHARMIRLLQGGDSVAMEMDIRNTFTDNIHVNNVIAEIEGTDPKLKKEIVLIGAHLDSWHGGTGGADNAAGCATMIEAMRILNALNIKPKRTIRLALWGGEEIGHYGSRGYASKYLYDKEKGQRKAGYDDFVIYLNMDYGSGRFRGVYLEENDMARPYFETWMPPLKSLGFTTLSPEAVDSTDHVNFAGIGLPAFQFIQDWLDYFRAYHTTMDTYERVSLDDVRVNAVITAWLALNAANDPGRIPAKPIQ